MEERPDIGEIVLKAKEDRARAIEAAEAAERAERERKDREEPLRDMETEERAAEEALGPRVTTVAEAAVVRRPDYTSETYVPLIPHLFVPSGFSSYTPQRSEYDDETVLRDPLVHIANTWAVAPAEWVNEAVRRMLALENLVRQAAGGFQLELRYPTRSSQVAAGKEPVGQTMARAEEQFRIAVRKRPSLEEQRAHKRPKLVLLPTFEDEKEDDGDEKVDEEEEEEEEEHSPARSDSDDSVDDPAYQEDPKDGADDDDDGSDDDGGRTGLEDWFGGED
ncbi:hypothetical protein RHMOL_Rhmol04G0194600 [Rhododendron molle]|uniref:Uncharacterized protein n=1 Tax=Rhododendron molle TaxID=49168 RepID=A0ACC0P237_RHOML|nr:hypothetical protein RHMOL_Rhmol04G0194600 [Rhododendron molle]